MAIFFAHALRCTQSFAHPLTCSLIHGERDSCLKIEYDFLSFVHRLDILAVIIQHLHVQVQSQCLGLPNPEVILMPRRRLIEN